jgi:hypothetical protein
MLARLRCFLLLLLPLSLLLSAAALRAARGPFWLATNFDPEYAYLLNGLSLIQGFGIHFVDHPGVPLTLFMAVLIRLAGGPCSGSGLQKLVLENPESFLSIAHWCLLVAYVMVLSWVGYRGARATRSLGFGLLWQTTPLLSGTALAALSRVAPETVLMLLSLALTLALFEYYHSEVGEPLGGSLASCLGVIVGIGVATKITFAPWILPPLLLLRSRSHRIRFVLGLAVSALLAALFLGTRLEYMLKWFGYLLLASGRYGQGPWTVVQPSALPSNLLQLAKGEYVLALILASLSVSWIVALRRGRDANLGGALAAGIVVQFLLAAKHPAQHYLIPAIGTAGFGIAVLLRREGEVKRAALLPRRLSSALVMCFVLVVPGLRAASVPSMVHSLAGASSEMLSVSERANRLGEGCRLIRYYRSSAPAFALHFGNTWANSRFSDNLRKLYPTYWEYDVFNHLYRDPAGIVVPEKTALAAPCVLLQGEPLREDLAVRSPEIRMRDLLQGQHETIYQVTGASSVATRGGRVGSPSRQPD